MDSAVLFTDRQTWILLSCSLIDTHKQKPTKIEIRPQEEKHVALPESSRCQLNPVFFEKSHGESVVSDLASSVLTEELLPAAHSLMSCECHVG